jgi:TonB family protein
MYLSGNFRLLYFSLILLMHLLLTASILFPDESRQVNDMASGGIKSGYRITYAGSGDITPRHENGPAAGVSAAAESEVKTERNTASREHSSQKTGALHESQNGQDHAKKDTAVTAVSYAKRRQSDDGRGNRQTVKKPEQSSAAAEVRTAEGSRLHDNKKNSEQSGRKTSAGGGSQCRETSGCLSGTGREVFSSGSIAGGSGVAAASQNSGSGAGGAGGALRDISSVELVYRPRFVYPSQARRFGRQGQVTLVLHVDSSGKVVKVDLEKSSGYADLDRSASDYGAEFRFKGISGGFRVRVPVLYRLR